MLRLRIEQMQAPPVVGPVVAPPPPEPVAEELAPPTPVFEPAEIAAPAPARDWEALLTAKWGVWLGAVALLLAGVFLVRYAADQGWLGPAVRCVALVMLGAALIGGGEWLHRRPPGKAEMADYAPPALAAGGVAMLFGAAYMAAVLYALVPAPVGFGLMAAASLSGLALSLRLGQLVAAVGLVGAFGTPLLVQTDDPSLPGLFLYLLFVTAAAWAVVRYTAWVWLGWATTIADALWVVAAAFAPANGVWAAGLFVPAAAAINLALLPPAALEQPVGRQLARIAQIALGAAGLLLSLTQPEFATRLGVLLLAPLAVGKGAWEPRLDRLPWLAAFLFLLLITAWGLPPWQPTGEAILADGKIFATLPGAWLPTALDPLLQTAALMAAAFAAAGLWFERTAPRPLRWSALTAAVPVLTLIILYARVMAFQPNDLWVGTSVLLAAGLTAATAWSAREGRRQSAGAHAAGATAALALACAMLLSAQWLTLAYALFLPPLAWIEARADLPALRRVALAVAAVALVRLLLNPNVLDYGLGEWPVLNQVLAVYLVAAAAFAASAWMFRRRGDDLTVAVLELSSAAFVTVLVILEVRQWAGPGGGAEFLQAALDVSGLAVLAMLTLRLEGRTGRPMLGWAWRIQGGLALAGGLALLMGNPAFFYSFVGTRPLFDALLPAYLVPAVVAALAIRPVPPSLRTPLACYALFAVFAWITLEIRHLFHPEDMALNEEAILDPELWAWSGAWMAYGLALMAGGVVSGRKPLRLAALSLIALAGAKVFLIDMGGLVGLWRVLSFLGLGLTLIGLGAVYRRFVAQQD